MSTEDKNVVVAFKAADIGEPPMTVKRENFNFCKHDRIECDEHTRTLICHDCGSTLDAFNFVRKSALTIQNAWSRYSQVQKQASELVERVDALKKEEQRIKSRIRTARDKVPIISTRGTL
jgi:hypothetical protein